MQRIIDSVPSKQKPESEPQLERRRFKGKKLKREFFNFLSARLGKNFADWINIFPNDMYTQLSSLQFTSLLNEKSRQNHWGYELNMMNSVIKSREAIFRFFGVSGDAQQTDFLKKLIFMITISDIGKAGPVLYDENKPESVAARIYNNLILKLNHAELLKSIDLNNLPPELARLIAGMESTFTSTPFLKDEIFTSGFFLLAPIELALYLGRAVLGGMIPRNKRGLNKKVQSHLSLTPKETQHLISLGFDPKKTSIGTFYSNYHIVAGEKFLMNEIKLPDQYQYLVQLGLCHHFSQGVRPSLLVEYDELLSNETNFKIVAFLEILDKVEAAFNRSKEKKSDETVNRVLNEKIVPAIKKNYPPEKVDFMIQVYTEVFLAMKQMKIFAKL